MATFPKTGLDELLTPEKSVPVLIDHQPFQFSNLHSHEPTVVVNDVVGLAKANKVFNVPTVPTTVIEERGGNVLQPLQDVFPDQKRSTEPPSTPERALGWWTRCRSPVARS